MLPRRQVFFTRKENKTEQAQYDRMGLLDWIQRGWNAIKGLWGTRHNPMTPVRKKIGAEIYHGNGDVLQGYLDEVRKAADALPDPEPAPGAWPQTPPGSRYTTAPTTRRSSFVDS